MKKILSLLLLALLSVTQAMAYDFEVDGIYYTKSGTNAIVTYGDTRPTPQYTGDLVIPSSVEYQGTTYSVREIGESAFSGCTINTLTLSEGIRNIGIFALENSKIHEIKVPTTLYEVRSTYVSGSSSSFAPKIDILAVESIESWLGTTSSNNSRYTLLNGLDGSTKLKVNGEIVEDLVIPDGITSLPYGSFQNLNIKSVSCPSNVTGIGNGAFYGCNSLKKITISKIEGGGLKIEYRSIPASVEEIQFYGSLQSWFEIQGLEYLTNVSEKDLYINGTLLEDLELPTTVTNIPAYAFAKVRNLSSVTLPATLTTIGASAFYGCKDLSSLNLPNQLKTIGASAFYGCNLLKDISIPSSVTSIGTDVFAECYLETLELPFLGNTPTVPATLQSLTNAASLKSVTVCDGDIAANAFAGCLNTSIFLANPQNIGAGALVGNISVTMGNCDVPTLADASAIGSNCIVFVPQDKLEMYKSADIWSQFALQIIPIGASTEFTINSTAQATASDLHMKIGEANLANVVSLKVNGAINGYDLMIMREKMINLRHLDLSNATFVYNEYLYNTAGYHSEDKVLTSYSLNPALASLVLPKNLTKIANYACADCSYLKEITIPEGVTSIGDYAFSGCSSLEDIVWNENLTSLGNSAFNECKSLQYIALPASLTYKGKDILKGCDHLVEVTIPFMGSTIEKGDKFNYTISAGSSSTNYAGSNGFVFPKTLKKFTVLAGDITDYAFAAQIPIGSAANYQFDLIFGDGVTRFGKGVFMWNDSYVNGSIKSVALGKNVKYFDDYAFYGISAIKELNFDNVEYIGQYAFSKTSLEKVVIPANLQTFGNYAFANNKNLESVTLPVNSQLNTIPVGAFMGCPAIERVDLPVSVRKIGEKAFQNCTALTEVRIPSGMTNVGNYAFDGCPNLNNVYTYTVEPQDIQQDTFSSYQTATLYCPKVSYYNYYYATPWNRFLHLEPFDEPYQYVYIEKDFNIFSDVISGEPEFRIGTGGGLIMNGVVKQVADMLHIKFDPSIGKGSSIISNGMIDAYTLKVDIDVKKDFWHFFCFPFDVDLTNGVEKDGSWIFREFDGMSRAENGAGNSWKDITGTKLEAGKGYIFRTNTAGTLTLTVAGLAGGKIDLRCSNIVKQLQNCFKGGSSAATEPANKNWNFIGNGYLSYYDINDLDYSAPIMTWDGSKYVAYRPGDDDYVLTPFQGFFVQKPESNDAGVGFKADARTTYLKSQDPAARSAARRKAAARLDSSRKLVNLTVSNTADEEATADKARVVFNEKQTMDYELECDASKFISTENVPLIYSLDARGTRYAINERPMADGRVNLGFIAREDGQYTIAATRMDVPVVLIDNATGTTHDLNDGDYIFTADKGTYEQRFVLAVAEDYLTDGITTVSTDEQGAAANIYDLQGKRVERQQQGVTIQNGKKVVSAM